jgi:predicted RNA methylase
MSIEIVIGLPHLNEGPILTRARRLQQPMLISANALSSWSSRRGWREWTGWRLGQLANAYGLAALDLDSAGFVAMACYRGFPWSVDDYFHLASAFPFRRIASLDYCTETEVAADREEVLDRISRTIRANRDCRERAADLGLLDRLMPVIQGRRPSDYERCIDALWLSIQPGTVIGVGSMCRREIAGPEGLIAVVEHLDRILPAGVTLHAFGVKGSALPYLAPFSGRIASIDSQAYGIAARRDAYRRRMSKSDALVAEHMERWTHQQLARLTEPPRRLRHQAARSCSSFPANAWEAAIRHARAEIRDLIESGDLDHDEITDAWIEQWAADIYRAPFGDRGSGREGGSGGVRARGSRSFAGEPPMTYPLFAAPAAVSEPCAKAISLLDIARLLTGRLAKGTSVSRQTLKAMMRERFGGSDAWGDWSMRDAYEALEAAQVLLALDPAIGLIDYDNPVAATAARDRLSRLLPTQSYRSERQVDLQQFSTPLHLAWLAAHAARITDADTVLEPSAGTGMLAVHARQLGAQLILNERDPLRADLLALTLDQQVSRHDAEFIHDMLDPADRPNVVLINPPFSRSEGRGRDRHAGARHLRSALLRLADGGRCVAIMSPASARDGTGSQGYDAVTSLVPARFEITINGQPYAKHGTAISIRLVIFDKGWIGETECHVVADLRGALPIVLNVPPRLDAGEPPLPPVAVEQFGPARPLLAAPARAGSLFARVEPLRPITPPPAPMIAGEPELLAYEALATPPAAGEQIGIYVPWRLARMAFTDANPHPDQLVESVAMSSILPPLPSYRPMLPPRAVSALSEAQLETVIYAGQAFARDLPGRFVPNQAGTLLTPDTDGHIYRLGFMVGDGTGVGKGQQIAACILDRWCRGQRRAIWISKSSALLEDARRDWSALGGMAIDIQPLDAFAFGTPITMDSGILFLTFATLRSQRDDAQSRLQQLLAWLGEDFDGVIAIDEAHELANAAGTDTQYGTQKGSEQGLAGVRLQNLLPRACILYNSATGATDPANLCYTSRLGLWGQGSAFDTREAFMTAIGSGGIAAMEIVARDLKALGLYTARALTFCGVEYDPLEHKLTHDQIAVYDAYADAWALIHQNLDTVLVMLSSTLHVFFAVAVYVECGGGRRRFPSVFHDFTPDNMWVRGNVRGRARPAFERR